MSEATANKDGGEGTPGEAPGGISALRRIDHLLGLVEQAILVVSLISLVAVGVYQAIASHLLDKHATWPYELLRYSVFFIAMSGAAMAAQRDRIINMDVVTRMLQPKLRQILRSVLALFVIFVCILLYKGGMAVREQAGTLNEQYDLISPSVGLLALPIGSILIAVHYLLHAVVDVMYLMRDELTPDSSEMKVH